MKTARWIIGIIALIFSVAIIAQASAVMAIETAEGQNATSGGAGGFVAILYIVAGVLGITCRKFKVGTIIAGVLFALAGLVGVTTSGAYAILPFWGLIALVFAIVFIVGAVIQKPTRKTAKTQLPPSTEQVSTEMPVLPVTSQKPKRKWWFWLIIAIVALLVIAIMGGSISLANDYRRLVPPTPAVVVPPPASSTPITSQVTSSASLAPDSVSEVSSAISSQPSSQSQVESAASSAPESIITSTAPKTDPPASTAPVTDTFTLSAGHYVAGVDIPVGKCDVVAVSGTGNLSSSNMFSGGINEMFGIDDGTGWYTEAFNGLKLPKSTTLTVQGPLTIKITFTAIDEGYTGRQYSESAAITLSSGNYEAGTDFDAGTYSIVLVSGYGNISSSNMFDTGINEVFGAHDGILSIQEMQNVTLPKKTELSISGGLVVKLIPAS